MSVEPAPTFGLRVQLMVRDEIGRYLFLSGAEDAPALRLPGGGVSGEESLYGAGLRHLREQAASSARIERMIGSFVHSEGGETAACLVFEGRVSAAAGAAAAQENGVCWLTLREAIARREEMQAPLQKFLLRLGREKGYGPEPAPASTEDAMTARLDRLSRQIRGFEEVRGRYVALADVLARHFRLVTARICPLALVDARAKSVASFAEKVLRKDKYSDPLREMTDLCGVRIVAHLQSEVDAICAYIRDNFLIDERNSLDARERLRSSEFGYRSIHYVVQATHGRIPDLDADLYECKAEIQVRTLLQHAWSDIGHDRLYKGGFRIPAVWDREAARIAALLESADESFGRMVEGLEGFRSDYGAYLSPQELADARATTAKIRAHDASNATLVEREARQAMAARDWEAARRIVEDFRGVRTAGLHLCLGTALCHLHESDPTSAGHRRGREALLAAAAASAADAEPRLRLAEFERDPGEKLRLFEAAYSADPSDPEALGSYVRAKIVIGRDSGFATLIAPSLESAISQCRLQIEAGLDEPRAWLRIARFQLLLRREGEALDALAHAVRQRTHCAALAPALDSAIEEVEALAALDPGRMDAVAFVRLLRLLRFSVQPDDPSRRALSGLQTPGANPIVGPVAIVAGGCDPGLTAALDEYRELLRCGFARFHGTVLSGGTREGVSGLVGELGNEAPGRIRTIGYLPARLPDDGTAHADPRYHETRVVQEGGGFGVLQPLQNWIDLIASGVEPSAVRLLGINGGRIAAMEFRIAWALGARVAIVRKSGREADKLEREISVGGFHGVLVLPHDRMTIRAFLQGGGPAPKPFDPSDVERLARQVHARFLDEQRHRNPDPAMRPWEHLREDLKTSNLDQVNYMAEILASAGLELAPESDPRPAADLDPRLQEMAEHEHGRWTVERIAAGWRLGPRNPAAKTSPYLVGWSELPVGIRDWDVKNVEGFPALLALVGLKAVTPDSTPSRRPPATSDAK